MKELYCGSTSTSTGAGNEILQKCITPGGMRGGKQADGVKEESRTLEIRT